MSQKLKPSNIYKSIPFPSTEEMNMYQWLEEAQAHGIVRQFIHQPDPYILSGPKTYDLEKQLKTKVKTVQKSLLNKHVYTADFAIYTDHVMPLDKRFQNTGVIVIDVKGGYQQYDGQRAFSINQKWVYSLFGIYVHKVVPEEFFKATFVPEGARYTKVTGKVQKCYRDTKLVAEYAEILKGDDMAEEPRGIRNNNPGNIKHGCDWQGLTSINGDPVFCTFVSMQYGIRAMAKILITYRDVHKLKTPEQVIKRWAPAEDNNDTRSYIQHVQGLVQRKNWGMQSTEALKEYVRAICVHENGQRWATKWMAYVNDGVGLAV